MKFFLTLYICSAMHNNCMPVMPDMFNYQQSHETFSSCIKDGLGQSFEVFYNSDLVNTDQINSGMLYPKFICEPFAPEQAET